MKTINEETLEYARELLEVMKKVREEIITKKIFEIPEDVKAKAPEILLETFYMSMKDLIEKSVKENQKTKQQNKEARR